MKLRQLIPLFFALTIFNLIPYGLCFNASQPLNMTSWPEGLGSQLSIGDFEAGILLSGIMLSVILFPVALWERRGMYAKLIIGLVFGGFCIAIGWLPTYFLIVIAVLVALMLAGQSRKWISG